MNHTLRRSPSLKGLVYAIMHSLTIVTARARSHPTTSSITAVVDQPLP